MSETTAAFYKKVTALEREMQKLKVRAFFALAKKPETTAYPISDIMRALKKTRVSLWRSRYVKKTSRIS